MFEIGIGTGLQLQDILKYKVKDLRNKTSLQVKIGVRKMERTYDVPEELQEIIRSYTKGMADASLSDIILFSPRVGTIP